MGDKPRSNRKGLGIRDALNEKRNLHLRAAREKAEEIIEEIDVKNGLLKAQEQGENECKFDFPRYVQLEDYFIGNLCYEDVLENLKEILKDEGLTCELSFSEGYWGKAKCGCEIVRPPNWVEYNHRFEQGEDSGEDSWGWECPWCDSYYHEPLSGDGQKIVEHYYELYEWEGTTAEDGTTIGYITISFND